MNRRAVCIAIAIAVLAGCSDTSERDSMGSEQIEEAQPAASPSTVDQAAETSMPVAWPGLVHDRGVAVHRMSRDSASSSGGRAWNDPRDAPVGWVDVVRISLSSPEGQAHWYVELADWPPLVADTEPGLLIAYGLVVDTNGDAVADYLVGIDNDAPEQGDLRVWVTELATGQTDQQLGAPYGYPVEFSHPGESDPPPGLPPTMVFTFLGNTKPADLEPSTARFYAWTSATRDGQVVAYDFAPDTGWLTVDKP